MRYCLFSIIFCICACCQAASLTSDSLTQIIAGSKTHYGLDNFKMVMPQVLYRGGSANGKSPMLMRSAQALCKDGFSQAVYLYDKNWNYSQVQTVKCGIGQLNYTKKRWDHPAEIYQILSTLHSIIINHKGPTYIHCWYGMHASGYVAAVALRQFCGWSAQQAVTYWNSNVPQKIQYKKVQNMVSTFKPYPDLLINSQQQARVCPNPEDKAPQRS